MNSTEQEYVVALHKYITTEIKLGKKAKDVYLNNQDMDIILMALKIAGEL